MGRGAYTRHLSLSVVLIDPGRRYERMLIGVIVIFLLVVVRLRLSESEHMRDPNR